MEYVNMEELEKKYINIEELKKAFNTCKVLGETISIDTALAVIDTVKKHSHWNRVEEKQPYLFYMRDLKTKKIVLTSFELLIVVSVDDNSQLVMPGFFKDGEWEFKTKEILQLTRKFKVTHWMYMPEPPREEK